MSIGELVFRYAIIFLVLLTLFILVVRRRKAAGKIVFPQLHWSHAFQLLNELDGAFWLKIAITLTIASSAGVIIAVFVLPYGTAWALGALTAVLFGLAVSLPKLLA
jgi:hypothetical protein